MANIFSAAEKEIFSRALQDKFQKAGLSEMLEQKYETTNNHLDEEFLNRMASGYHLIKDNALQGI
ncbi:hypothetical protein [Candidatus Nitrotoga sp. 1052]|uniref:hypothetical protein n=1 Tax=Candidatus Nitrotoga sp. 1052 TaxID=2886964 RepID=UPI001EF4794E|nr:hypothetical protein [Candidatus Nitrotoga sp. 1052]CAH1092900.1 hypothetical protein NTG1052_980002 [Candidatus Nitrotoga sp. 1052]